MEQFLKKVEHPFVCPINLQEMTTTMMCYELPCKHVFSNAIVEWNKIKNSCPLCRTQILNVIDTKWFIVNEIGATILVFNIRLDLNITTVVEEEQKMRTLASIPESYSILHMIL